MIPLPVGRSSDLRESGYRSRIQELTYGLLSPLYDAFVRFVTLPLGGEAKWRAEIAEWLRPENGQHVLSLCCGTGTTDRAVLKRAPGVNLLGLDLGKGQLARARRKDTEGLIDYRQGNATDTGFESGSFDRVFIVGALHEMPRSLRAQVLREARRVCRSEGRALFVEPGPTATRWSSFTRSLFLFLWLPGNPETATTRDLVREGLRAELPAAGFEVEERHTTNPDWFEGLYVRPI